jgi:hypothetical protein
MYKVSKISRSDINFYNTLGPVFGSRRIAKEVGINCYDDPDKQFYIATKNGLLAGLCSVNGNVISDCYVYPQHREKGVMTLLLKEVIKKPGKYRATCTHESKSCFAKLGFKVKKELKNFTMMELTIA